jgi:hypothetical protein
MQLLPGYVVGVSGADDRSPVMMASSASGSSVRGFVMTARAILMYQRRVIS